MNILKCALGLTNFPLVLLRFMTGITSFPFPLKFVSWTQEILIKYQFNCKNRFQLLKLALGSVWKILSICLGLRSSVVYKFSCAGCNMPATLARRADTFQHAWTSTLQGIKPLIFINILLLLINDIFFKFSQLLRILSQASTQTEAIYINSKKPLLTHKLSMSV